MPVTSRALSVQRCGGRAQWPKMGASRAKAQAAFPQMIAFSLQAKKMFRFQAQIGKSIFVFRLEYKFEIIPYTPMELGMKCFIINNIRLTYKA
jgi:hypothetical protein